MCRAQNCAQGNSANQQASVTDFEGGWGSDHSDLYLYHYPVGYTNTIYQGIKPSELSSVAMQPGTKDTGVAATDSYH